MTRTRTHRVEMPRRSEWGDVKRVWKIIFFSIIFPSRGSVITISFSIAFFHKVSGWHSSNVWFMLKAHTPQRSNSIQSVSSFPCVLYSKLAVRSCHHRNVDYFPTTSPPQVFYSSYTAVITDDYFIKNDTLYFLSVFSCSSSRGTSVKQVSPGKKNTNKKNDTWFVTEKHLERFTLSSQNKCFFSIS